MSVKSLLAKGIKWCMRHDREILKGVSMATSVASMVMAWKARPRCEEILLEKEAEGASNLEKAKAIAPVVAPMLIMQGVSIGTNVLEYKKTGQKLAGLVNAVSSYKAIDDIRKEIEKERLTPETLKDVDDEATKKRLETVPVEEIEKTGHGDTMFIEPKYTAKVWKSSKDRFELGVEKANNKIARCYDKYGTCVRDDFAITMWDFLKGQGLSAADLHDTLEFQARDYKGGLPVHLEPIEFTNADGGEELGYKVVFDHPPTLAYSDMIAG